ncbi:MAG: hypothetical protein QOE06_2995 [Thermoleophilaceae bacterium]|jgi:hypothetical protein|nr:hypothetical protein [Thermoleophilaceae bacterium]
MRTRLLVLTAACLALAVPATSIAPALAGGHDVNAAKAKKKKKKKKKTKKPASYKGTWTGTFAAGGSISITFGTNGQLSVTVDKVQADCDDGNGNKSKRDISITMTGSGVPDSKGTLKKTDLGTFQKPNTSGSVGGKFATKPATGTFSYLDIQCELNDAAWSATK